MHMADALISPTVGGVMGAITLGLVAYSAKKVRQVSLDERVPLMGVMGALIFAAQMINFAIPGTGSSGHLGGGLILAALLGPEAGFLTMAAILTIQALLFADGGLLALGCNVFNLGFWSCFVGYPIFFKPWLKHAASPKRMLIGSMIAAIISLQLGALSVVLETVASEIAALPFRTFASVMQPIHLAIGIAEGLITAAVLGFIRQARPELLNALTVPGAARRPLRSMLVGTLTVAIFTGGVLAWFASSQPDGLEWAILRTSGQEAVANQTAFHQTLAKLQQKVAVLPDYQFKIANPRGETAPVSGFKADGATSAAGIVGVVLTVGLTSLFGLGLKWAVRRRIHE